MTDHLVVPYAALGRVAREWDDQHHRLDAAATQVAEAPVAGLSPAVVGAATMFRYRWDQHLRALGRTTEDRADRLRDTLRDLVGADESSATLGFVLGHLLQEVR